MKHLTDIEIQVFLDGVSSEADVIRQHISVCAECRREIDLYTTVYTGLSNEINEGLSVEFADNVMAALPDAEPKGLERFSMEMLLIPGSIAASIAIIFYYFGTGWISSLFGWFTLPEAGLIDVTAVKAYISEMQSIGEFGYLTLGAGVILMLAFFDKIIVKFRLTDFFNRRLSML